MLPKGVRERAAGAAAPPANASDTQTHTVGTDLLRRKGKRKLSLLFSRAPARSPPPASPQPTERHASDAAAGKGALASSAQLKWERGSDAGCCCSAAAAAAIAAGQPAGPWLLPRGASLSLSPRCCLPACLPAARHAARHAAHAALRSEGLEHGARRLDGPVNILLGVGEGGEAGLKLGGGQVHAVLQHAAVELGKLGGVCGKRKETFIFFGGGLERFKKCGCT